MGHDEAVRSFSEPRPIHRLISPIPIFMGVMGLGITLEAPPGDCPACVLALVLGSVATIALGLWYLLSVEEAVLDAGAGEVRLVKRWLSIVVHQQAVRLGDVSSVRLEREVRESLNGKEYTVWTVSLALGTGEVAKVLESKLDSPVDPVAWRCARALSSASGRPLEDRSTDPPTVRRAGELEVPVGERLRGSPFGRVSCLPPGHPVAEARTPDGVSFTWSDRAAWLGWTVLALDLLFLRDVFAEPRSSFVLGTVLGTAPDSISPLLAVPVAAVALVGLYLALFAFFGAEELMVGLRTVTLTTRIVVPFQTRSIVTSDIVEVRTAARAGIAGTRDLVVELVTGDDIFSVSGIWNEAQTEALAGRLRTVLAHELEAGSRGGRPSASI